MDWYKLDDIIYFDYNTVIFNDLNPFVFSSCQSHVENRHVLHDVIRDRYYRDFPETAQKVEE